MVESRPRAPQQALHGAVPMGRAVGQRSPALTEEWGAGRPGLESVRLRLLHGQGRGGELASACPAGLPAPPPVYAWKSVNTPQACCLQTFVSPAISLCEEHEYFTGPYN